MESKSFPGGTRPELAPGMYTSPEGKNARGRKCAEKLGMKEGTRLYYANRTGSKTLFKSDVNYE